MKITRITFLYFMLAFIVMSCSKIGNNCIPADFIGTWKGTATCSGQEEQATVIIFQNADGTFLSRYSGVILPTTLEQCTISGSGTSGFGEFKTNYSISGNLEESLLSVTIVSSGVKNKTCTVDLSKE